jgi:hypothetical protein
VLDVRVLKRKGVSGADQCGELAAYDREITARRQAQICHRQWPEIVARRLVSVDIRRAEGRQCIRAHLQKILQEAIGLLKKKLTVAQARQRVLIARGNIVLP